MNIEKIQEELQKLGFYAVVFGEENRLSIGRDDGIVPDLGWRMIGNPFAVYVIENKMVVDYAIGQIPKKETFSTISEGVKFIKNNIPLNP